ncbi:MAG: DUF7065 domain-containing protein [Acidimicrobiales bacterium]
MSDSEVNDAVFTAEDDGFHRLLGGDEWWFTETAWFSFHNIERRLGGWFYTMARHNIGTVAGGAWVWDDTAHLPWEVLHSANYSALELPAEADLRNVELPTGVSIAVEQPTMAYRLGYDDPGRYTADLRFEAASPPRPLVSSGSTFGNAAHFDQIGHVTGTIEVHGEPIAIDCWSMRDRTWGRRPEDRPRQAAYVTGAGQGGAGFLAVTNTRDGTDRVSYGFVNRGGESVGLVDGQRSVTRHPDNGWVETIRIDATDAAGNPFVAEGHSVSRITINRHSFIDLNSVIHWRLEGPDGGTEWFGEDQDMWPVHRWASAKRSGDWSIPR